MKKRWLVAVVLATMALSLAASVVGADVYDKWEGVFGRTTRQPSETMDATGYVEINYVKGQHNFNVYIYTENLLEGVAYEAFLRDDDLNNYSFGFFVPQYDADAGKVLGVLTMNHKEVVCEEVAAILSSEVTEWGPRVIVSRGPMANRCYILNTNTTEAGVPLEPVGSNRGE